MHMSGDRQNFVAPTRVADLGWKCNYYKEPEYRAKMDIKEIKDIRMPSTRTCVIIVIAAVALIVTFGIGLAMGGGEEEKISVHEEHKDHCPPKSPLHVKPSKSKEGHYSRAASVADTSLCSKIGSIVMELKGATAVEAAIAASVCLGVVNPHRSGIGGGNFITYYNRTAEEVHTVIGREQAPAGATADMFAGSEHASSQMGGKSIGIPGEVLGLYEAWKLGHGTMAWKELIGPSIKLCKLGFWVGPSLLKAMHNTELDGVPAAFKDFITNPETGKIYQAGDKMYRPNYAHTLQSIAEEGPYAFYNGSLAENITLDIQDAGGIITMEDLASYTAPVKSAVKFRLHDHMTVYSPPPPSSGAVYQYILNILTGYNMDKTSVSTVDHALTTYHRIVEAFKHAFALRSQLGDICVGTQDFKAHVLQLVTNMTDPDFGKLTRALISDRKTQESAHYKQKYANDWDTAGSHFSVVGPHGDAVAITGSVNFNFGSKVIGSRTGIVFNNQMDDFTTPGTVNSFGIPASPANTIAPGKRPLSSMSPSIVVDGHGDVKLVIGSCGGPRIITSLALITIDALMFDWDIKEAIDYPRMHHQLFPEQLRVEKGFPEEVIDGLRGMGHNIEVYPRIFSAAQGIKQTGGKLSANSDYRKGGEAQGFI